MVNRRGFLKALGIGLAAPAIVRAESLMKIVVPKKELILPVYPDSFDLSGDFTIEAWVLKENDGPFFADGFIDEIRITKGVARDLAGKESKHVPVQILGHKFDAKELFTGGNVKLKQNEWTHIAYTRRGSEVTQSVVESFNNGSLAMSGNDGMLASASMGNLPQIGMRI